MNKLSHKPNAHALLYYHELAILNIISCGSTYYVTNDQIIA